MASDDMSKFHDKLRQAKNIVAVCGAGLSAASGIPTFRGAGGIWRQYDAMSLATPEAFYDNPSRCWAFYEYRRRKAVQAEPNEAHRTLSKLLDPEIRKNIIPECTSFHMITQNVDGLSRKANAEICGANDGAKLPYYEMHGSVLEQFCTQCKAGFTFSEDAPIVPSLSNILEEVETNGPEVKISLKSLPSCSNCSGLLRPNVVWFGEMPRYLDLIYPVLRKTDLLLVVGTSSTVYPAAGFSHKAKQAGATVAVFNLEPSAGDEEADFVFHGPCEQSLPEALKR